ncbi:hypothetical protein [Actinomadura roseirufa]|uniref:hypothetical protein n=1 Tax=Actinomadura roseirufa TaxID=2094049 RepID=UPI00104146C3|nr:hypothetical protein [Actinomadura roseirufa]
MKRGSLKSAGMSYLSLRGLLLIPAGAVFVASGLTNMDWVTSAHGWVFVGVVLVAALVYLRLARYYNEHYGRVSPSRRTQVRLSITAVVSSVLVVAGVQGDWSLDLPIDGTAAAFALLVLGNYAVGREFRTHQLVIWGFVLTAALLPLWGGVDPDVKINAGIVTMGVATMVTGVFDHLALRRRFGPAAGMDEADLCDG